MNEIEFFIINWIEEKTGFVLRTNQNFFDSPAFDSLSFAQLISALEEEFDLEINFMELDDWTTVLTPSGLFLHIESL